MSLFQLIITPLLAVLFARSVIKALRSPRHRVATSTGALIWLAAAVAVLHPGLTIRAADTLGIGRGADLVLYLFVIAFLLSVFYFYNRMLQLEAAVTKIVRVLALSEPARTQPTQPAPEQQAKQLANVPHHSS